MLIIAPPLVRIGWTMVKYIFPASARKKMIFLGTDNYLPVLDQYVDLDVLPPCIYPLGRGCTAPGMPKLIGEDEDAHVIPMEDPTDTSESSHSMDPPSRVRVGVDCKTILSGEWKEDPPRGVRRISN